MHLRLLLVVAATSVGCSPSPDSALALRTSDVVYGEDNRQEVYQLAPDSALRAAARSVAAVIPKSYLKYDGRGRPVLRGPTLEDLLGACPGGRFSLQTSLAECTAVLVDDNLLATAGHCFKHAFDCQNYVFVFDYLYDTEGGAIAVDAEDIFECRKAQVQENDLNQVRPLRDYAIIELTARVAGRDPLVARDSAPVVGEALAVISAGNGIPLKVDTGARVLGTTSIWQDYFALDTDTFDGASGAPVLDESGVVLGLAVRGQDDYRLDDAAGCLVVNTLARPELRGDEADKLSDAAAAIGTKDPLYAEEASL